MGGENELWEIPKLEQGTELELESFDCQIQYLPPFPQLCPA